jgi:hypothetical protein
MENGVPRNGIVHPILFFHVAPKAVGLSSRRRFGILVIIALEVKPRNFVTCGVVKAIFWVNTVSKKENQHVAKVRVLHKSYYLLAIRCDQIDASLERSRIFAFQKIGEKHQLQKLGNLISCIFISLQEIDISNVVSHTQSHLFGRRYFKLGWLY